MFFAISWAKLPISASFGTFSVSLFLAEISDIFFIVREGEPIYVGMWLEGALEAFNIYHAAQLANITPPTDVGDQNNRA
jgi:hypothetical protein